jgi:hypothetical protein
MTNIGKTIELAFGGRFKTDATKETWSAVLWSSEVAGNFRSKFVAR